MSHDEFCRAMVRWINGHLRPEGPPVHADTALFEEGGIDSLRILHLLAWTERALGRPIPDEELVMDSFRTVSTIGRRFLGAPR